MVHDSLCTILITCFFNVKFFVLLLLFVGINVCISHVSLNVSPPHPLLVKRLDSNLAFSNPDISAFEIPGILIILLVIGIFVAQFLNLFLMNSRFVTFDTSLDMLPQVSISNKYCINLLALWLLVAFYFAIFDKYLFILLPREIFVIPTFNKYKIFILFSQFTRGSNLCLHGACFFTYRMASCLLILFCNNITHCTFEILILWYMKLKLILSSDVHPNPGPGPPGHGSGHGTGYSSGFLSICNWNLNTLSKNDFQRVTFLEAHNANYNYDIISLCETSLNDEILVPDNILKGYNFYSCNHPTGEKRGGVGIFYKESLPLRIRNDLSFDECIVSELNYGHKQIFFTVLYRNPINKAASPEFASFIQKFENLYLKIKSENPYMMLFAGDFNAHSHTWWSEGDNNYEGIHLANMISDLNMTQIISEPTHFRENSKPSCIDLIISDQPNLILDSGVRPSLDPSCKHQITFCKINFKIPPLPVYARKIWHFSRAKTNLIRRAISEFPWEARLARIPNPNCQVELLNKTILNIMSNFVPSKITKIKPFESKWLTRNIKNMLRKQNRLYRKYKRNGFKNDEKEIVDRFRENVPGKLKIPNKNI